MQDRRDAGVTVPVPKLAADLNLPEGIWLHIGGSVRAAGWTVLDALPGLHVDVVGECTDLSAFADGSCAVVYSSHVLEHLGYDAALPKALGEFMRVLAPGGLLLASVPDLHVLCSLFVDPRVDPADKFMVMRMMFGGRTSTYDVHHTGFNGGLLHSFLRQAGFVDIQRVESLGCFADTSQMLFLGVPISLNVVARKPQ